MYKQPRATYKQEKLKKINKPWTFLVKNKSISANSKKYYLLVKHFGALFHERMTPKQVLEQSPS
jgi:hypothetical protein